MMVGKTRKVANIFRERLELISREYWDVLLPRLHTNKMFLRRPPKWPSAPQEVSYAVPVLPTDTAPVQLVSTSYRYTVWAVRDDVTVRGVMKLPRLYVKFINKIIYLNFIHTFMCMYIIIFVYVHVYILQ